MSRFGSNTELTRAVRRLPPAAGPTDAGRLRQHATPLLKASYASIDDAELIGNKLGYKLDRAMTTDDTKVFVNRTTGKPLIAHRGSTTAADWLQTDVNLALGREKNDPRFIRSAQYTRDVEAKYGRASDAIGHSLGGALARQSGATGNILAYNPGVGLGRVGRTPEAQDREEVYRTRADPVSALAGSERGINLKTVPQTLGRSSILTHLAQPRLLTLGRYLAGAHGVDNLRNMT